MNQNYDEIKGIFILLLYALSQMVLNFYQIQAKVCWYLSNPLQYFTNSISYDQDCGAPWDARLIFYGSMIDFWKFHLFSTPFWWKMG